ncbi:diacylglycerol O-acyltransferase [Roseiarcus fermentans]|uniref:diacylglycerol O-acyltransferase n=1 Tax=Roseiarcus fermentans TaxID=1473586 RepID=A0A366EQE9_9HYPH|nr:wax ester/triacylglycerol synthase family O-acyltransferase [Roseiarcus fermentans]RBP04643.1 diacylglycerol O-acyltransferase [Roseiarcus fermentans]
MSHRERMSPVDTTWLRMDRPNNLMMIIGVWMLEGPVALDEVEAQIADGLLGYRRYRQLVERTASGVFWRDDPNFDLGRHIHRIRLPGRGGKHALERLVGELASEPLDPNHPLWTVHVVEKYEGGAAVIFRMHHAIADGMALMDVTMKLVDGPQHRAASPGGDHEEEGFLQGLMAPVVAAINSGAEVSGSAVKTALGLVRDPLRAAGLLRDGAGVAAELGYLLIMAKDSATRFKGKPGGTKRVAWSEPLHLPEVKAVSRALGCSINDILLSSVAGAMRRYLSDCGDRTAGVECRALVPINLRAPGDVELGNRFGIIGVELPVGIEDPLERLATVRRRMLALKTSYEPQTTLGLFAALGVLPKIVQDKLFDLIVSRATAVMTNVPGPAEPLTVAGSLLKQSLFWVPQTGDTGMGVSILSYAGKVQFGLITDVALTPVPEAVVRHFHEEFEKYLYFVLLDAAGEDEAEAAQ